MVNVVVLVEAADDARIVCDLADRVLVEEGKIKDIGKKRNWIALENGSSVTTIETPPHTIWKRIDDLFDGSRKGNRRPKYLGYVSGVPQKNHYAVCRKAILLVNELQKTQRVDAMLMHQDLDHEPERLQGMEQAREEVAGEIEILLATPDREIEAWVLNGFIAENTAEKKKLAEWKRRINFDPCTQAERATGANERDPKKIIKDLTNGDYDRKAQCWNTTKLETLRQNGKNTYLQHYLDEVQKRLLPLLLQ